MKKNLQFMIILGCTLLGTQTDLFAYTDAEVQAFTEDQVHALTEEQIYSLTPTQLLNALPKFAISNWCPGAKIKNILCATSKPGMKPYKPGSQYEGISDSQIYKMTKAQLTALPKGIYDKLYKYKGAAVKYVLNQPQPSV